MDFNHNLCKLLANYLLNKACDTFLAVKYENLESNDTSLVEFLIKSKKLLITSVANLYGIPYPVRTKNFWYGIERNPVPYMKLFDVIWYGI